MNCGKILDIVYEYSADEADTENSMPLLYQMQVWIHTFLCQDCARKIGYLDEARSVLREDFYQYTAGSPGFEDSIMAKISAEEEPQNFYTTPGGVSTRGWIITGLIILVSLATAFFGFDFRSMATEYGISFMLPMGITIGIVLTTYGAFFIGSHLKVLSERFGL
jgi:hypothetical protein